jgi:hypothetical protein
MCVLLTLLQVATIPLLRHKADDDAAYQQQQQQAWQAQQLVNRPSTSHPTAISSANNPPRPASVAAIRSSSSRSASAVDSGALYGGTDGFKWGGPTSGLDETLLLPSCAPAAQRPHSSVGHAADRSGGGGGGGGEAASTSGSARKPSPLGSPIPQQVSFRTCFIGLGYVFFA